MNDWRHAMPPLFSLVGAIVGLALTGCDTAPVRTTRAPAWIALERTRGRDRPSPVYIVTLFADGHVLFEGRADVKSKGTFTRTIPAAQAAALIAELDGLNIWEREPKYDVERGGQGGDDRILRVAPPEAASDVLTAESRGRFKRIDGLFFAPRDLIDFKARVEAAVDLAEWIGPPGEWKD